MCFSAPGWNHAQVRNGGIRTPGAVALQGGLHCKQVIISRLFRLSDEYLSRYRSYRVNFTGSSGQLNWTLINSIFSDRRTEKLYLF
jgi:hypothetical protein